MKNPAKNTPQAAATPPPAAPAPAAVATPPAAPVAPPPTTPPPDSTGAPKPAEAAAPEVKREPQVITGEQAEQLVAHGMSEAQVLALVPPAVLESDDALIREKMRAGLSRSQAIEVITAQREHDRALAAKK